MTNRGQFSQLLAPAMMHIIMEDLQAHQEEYSQFLDVKSSSRAYEEDQILAGFGLAHEKPEGETITYDDPIEGATKRYIHVPYSLGWQVTKEMIADDQYSKMEKMPKEMIRGCRQTWEQVGANVLNLGFTTVLTADGEALFDTVHPLLGGGTYPNRLNPDQEFGVTSLQDILILFEYMVNERGLKVSLSPTDLWIPADLQFVVSRVLQSQFEPFSGENQVNPLQNRLNPHILHYLSDTNAWFVSSKDKNDARFYWRNRPEVESQDDFESKGTKHSVYFRISAGVTDWRGWAGSNP